MLLSVQPNGANLLPQPTPFWSLRAAAVAGELEPFRGDDAAAVAATENELSEVVRQQMIADVPLGAFLSGGIDSSTITALMQENSSRPVKTFTIGFREEGYDEAAHARAVARHLKTDHTELYVTAKDALEVVPSLCDLYDEPFGDSSQIPTYLLAKLARGKVTVALSGDGGDEVFAGYNRYYWTDFIWHRIRFLPLAMRRAASRYLLNLSESGWERLFIALKRFAPELVDQSLPLEKLRKAARVLGARDQSAMFLALLSHWEDPKSVVIEGHEPVTYPGEPRVWAELERFPAQMQYADTLTYLPTDILAKVDRASMGVSLEMRVPYLDHRVVELAWRLPWDMKVRGRTGKWILRQILYKRVPKELVERPKTGFSVPIGAWLRGPLRDWAEDLLDERRISESGFLDSKLISSMWHEHLAGTHNWEHRLWDILMFRAWKTRYIDNPA
jgi:asparagine synthase (glutamine-hydrolysing)